MFTLQKHNKTNIFCNEASEYGADTSYNTPKENLNQPNPDYANALKMMSWYSSLEKTTRKNENPNQVLVWMPGAWDIPQSLEGHDRIFAWIKPERSNPYTEVRDTLTWFRNQVQDTVAWILRADGVDIKKGTIQYGNTYFNPQERSVKYVKPFT